jgi:flagellin-like protein
MKFSRRASWGRARGRRRGVSEIVGTLLMLAIVVSLGVLVFTFASGSLASLTQSFTNLMSGQGNAVAEHLVVEQVIFTITGSPTTGGATVYVRNVGTISSTLVSVYVVDETTGAFVGQFPVTMTVNVQAVAAIPYGSTGNSAVCGSSSCGIAFIPVAGNTYQFTVTSSLGNSLVYNAEAI